MKIYKQYLIAFLFKPHIAQTKHRYSIVLRAAYKKKLKTKAFLLAKKNRSSYRSAGVLGWANFSWLRHPMYGCRNEFRMLDELLAALATDEFPDNMLAFNVPPREKELRTDALGDVWLEFKCDVDHREKPVCPWWLCADGLNSNGLRSDRCEPNELRDVVFEFSPAHRLMSELRFFVKLPGT